MKLSRFVALEDGTKVSLRQGIHPLHLATSRESSNGLQGDLTFQRLWYPLDVSFPSACYEEVAYLLLPVSPKVC